MRFVAKDLDQPRWGIRDSDRGAVLFYRFLHVDIGSAMYAMDPSAEIAAALSQLRQEGREIARVIIVGTDTLFAPRYEDSAGRDGALATFAHLLATLNDERVPYTWRTRGGLGNSVFPPAIARALLDAGGLCVVEVGLCSLDAELARALEGRKGAKLEERMRLMGALSSRGVLVSALLDPLVPMLTDQPAAVRKVLKELKAAGVFKVSARYLVLTRNRAKALARTLTPMNRDLIRGCFADEPWRQADDDGLTSSMHEAHKLLPPHLRKNGHRRIEEEAAALGIAVEILDRPSAVEEELRDRKVSKRKASRDRARRQKRAVPQLDLFGLKTHAS